MTLTSRPKPSLQFFEDLGPRLFGQDQVKTLHLKTKTFLFGVESTNLCTVYTVYPPALARFDMIGASLVYIQ